MSTPTEQINLLVGTAEVTDVTNGILARRWFRNASYITEALSELSIGLSTILLALSPSLNLPALNYISIGLNVSGISLRVLTSYALRESRNRTVEVNIITKKLQANELPDTVLNEEMLSTRSLPSARPTTPHPV